jgi:hypothetical protein
MIKDGVIVVLVAAIAYAHWRKQDPITILRGWLSGAKAWVQKKLHKTPA